MASSGVYTFKAVDPTGIPQKGEITGASKAAVTDELRSRGLTIQDVTEKPTGLKMEIALPKRVKAADLTVMTRQLSTMVSSGMTLLRAFYVLEEQVENPKLKETLGKVREDIEAGLLLSDALARHPKVFNPLYVAMVAAGEAGGVLEEALERVAVQLEADDSLRRQVKAAMMYPAVVLSFAVCVLIALITFIVPVFVDVFKDFGGDLPAITKFTVALSNAFTNQWYLILGGTIGAAVAFAKWRKSAWGRPQWDAFRLKIPMKIGQTVQKIALARWSRTFSALYSAGVPILQAIEVTGRTAGNAVLEKAMEEVVESVKAGGQIATPLKNAPIFPPMVAQMIAVGEETGGLDTMLNKVADFYEDEVAAAIKAMTSILEPVMIIFVGAIVGFVVIAMYMPMFKVYDNIR
ncbi:MAG TPA: type II secretion system F family protein [Solirubrobacteraceae bacterium]|nr:type II secretion system F family protein [Solirubrobacteraceae bacterium]